MRVFHRFKHTVSAGFESILDQLENQEAVVTAGIREVEQGAGRVRVHRKRAERRIAQLEERMATLEGEAKSWRERAVRLGGEREKALECVRRYRAAEQTRTSHAAELVQQRALREKIVEDEQAIEARLTELRTRCSALSSREARNTARSSAYRASDVDAVFDRWESRLEGSDDHELDPSPVDAFARGLSKDEDEAATLAELERLLASTEVSS